MNVYTKRVIEMNGKSLSKRKEQFFCEGSENTVVVTRTQVGNTPELFSIDSYQSRGEYSISSTYEPCEEKEFETVFRKAKASLNKMTHNDSAQ